VVFRELDISSRLRVLMAEDKLTVGELAAAAGVSKSAMEKYLAGPSSPRATAIASLCANLGLSVEWLLFGYADNDRVRIRNLGFGALFQLMQDLKTPGDLRDAFERAKLGSKEFSLFAVDLASERAEELGGDLWNMRKNAMRGAAQGYVEVAIEPIALPQNSRQKAKD
jgi:transcriptional regulator with XRE-family HTH domain